MPQALASTTTAAHSSKDCSETRKVPRNHAWPFMAVTLAPILCPVKAGRTDLRRASPLLCQRVLQWRISRVKLAPRRQFLQLLPARGGVRQRLHSLDDV